MISKYEKGLELFNKLHGGHSGEALVNSCASICPKIAEITIETVFGDLMQRKELDLKIRELAIIASLVTSYSLPQLRSHTEAAIAIGTTKEEIVEVILQTAYFAGFPAAANALMEIKDLF